MPTNIKQKKAQIKSKIEAVKRMNDDASGLVDSFIDKTFSDLPSMKGISGKKLSDLQSKIKKKQENVTNIFEDFVDLADSFLGLNKKYEPSNKLFDKQRLKQITQESINSTMKVSKQIITDVTQQTLFVGDGICGADKTFPSNLTLNVSPKEFDFMNVLTVDPTSNSGKLVYEPASPDKGNIKMNRVLYDTFSSDQTVTSKDGTDLFRMSWDDSNQNYVITGLTGNVGDFTTKYYSSIEFLDITGVTKTAVGMTLNGDPDSPPLFDKGFNDLNRLLEKILKACNSPKNGNSNLDMNRPQFSENEDDPDSYFDFDDVEGINLELEDDRYRKLLRFKDCGNLTVASNPYHFEDFVYLSENGDLNKAINDTLLKAAMTSYSDSQSTNTTPENFHISIMNSYILNLPKAMLGSILAPKYILPVVLIYKGIVLAGSNVATEVKVFMKKLSKFFSEVIKRHFWKFIQEFWSRIKKDLLEFLQKLALRIIKKMSKKYLYIIASLIALLGLALLLSNIDNCNSLYELINKTIDIALTGGVGTSPPGFLLTLATLRSGYSEDRALMNITQNLESAGVSTQPVFGQPNNLLALSKSIIDGHAKEENTNSKIMSGNLPTVLAGPTGPIPLLPGQIKFAGVKF